MMQRLLGAWLVLLCAVSPAWALNMELASEQL